MGHAEMSYRSFSRPCLPCTSTGWMSKCSWPMHHCWWIYITSWGIVGGTSCLVPCRGSIGDQECVKTWLIGPAVAWFANGISCLCHPRKSYAGWTKVACYSMDRALLWWVYSHRMRMGTINTLFLWIHSLVGEYLCHALVTKLKGCQVPV